MLLVQYKREKKLAQNDKKFCMSCSISQKQYIIWSSFVVHKCKMIISTGAFFHFFNILIFQVVSGVKQQKLAQNNKILCLSHSMSQEPYIIWPSFVVHKCEMIISTGTFIFSNFWFLGLLGGSKGKNGPKWQKNSVAPFISGTIHHTSFLVHMCKMTSPDALFIFSVFWFSRLLGGRAKE